MGLTGFWGPGGVAWVTCLLSGWDEGGEYGDVLRTAEGLEQMSQALGVEVEVQLAAAEAAWPRLYMIRAI